MLYRLLFGLAIVLTLSSGQHVFADEYEYGYGARGSDTPIETIANDSREAQVRRPNTLTLSPDESRMYVSQRDAGTMAIVEVASGKVISESPIGKRIVAAIPIRVVDDFTFLLAVDEESHELRLLRAEADRVEVVAKIATPPYPVGVAFDAQRGHAYVTSLWSRRLSRFTVESDASPTALSLDKTLDLEMAPRSITVMPRTSANDGITRLVVADSFGGHLAIIDADQWKVERVRTFPGHNVRALAITPEGDRIVMAHQMLNEHAHSLASDIQWGIVIQNDLRWLPLKNLLDSETVLYAGGHVHPLGSPGHGGADPSALALGGDRRVAVTLGGFNKVMIGREGDLSLRPIRVGQHPTAVVLNREGTRAYVANTFSDSITEIDMNAWRALREIKLGPTPELSLVEKGELVFYTARYSHQGWMSCHSCHSDGHTNMERNDNLSDGGFGAPKQVLTLLGRADTAPFAWNAGVPDLASQVENSIRKTMQTDVNPSPEDVESLTAYVAQLKSPPSVDKLRGTQDDEAIARGKQVFAERKCATCHEAPAYTVADVFDVGLSDENGQRKFNPPSLNGASQRDAYLHDGRAKTLEAVFREHGHPGAQEWTDREITDLVAFLRSL
jgi:sugar lactone lactonase YvrE